MVISEPTKSSTADRIESPHSVLHYLKPPVMPSAIHEIVQCAVTSLIGYFKATDKTEVTDGAELLQVKIAQEFLAFIASEFGGLMVSVFICSEKV